MLRRGLDVVVLVALLIMPLGLAKVTKPKARILSGHSGKVLLLQYGRTTFDRGNLELLANGVLPFPYKRAMFTPPIVQGAAAAPVGNVPHINQDEFSRQFMQAGIKTVAALRDWMTTVAFAVQHGYPVAGDWVSNYHDRAAEDLSLAAIAVSTPADQNGFQLLRAQFGNVRAWTGEIIAARDSLNAQWTITPGKVERNSSFQRISTCGTSLNAMLVSGTFQNDPACAEPSATELGYE